MSSWNDLPDIILTATLAAGIAALLFISYHGGAQDAAVVLNHYMENNCICICGGGSGAVGPTNENGWRMVLGTGNGGETLIVPGGLEGTT